MLTNYESPAMKLSAICDNGNSNSFSKSCTASMHFFLSKLILFQVIHGIHRIQMRMAPQIHPPHTFLHYIREAHLRIIQSLAFLWPYDTFAPTW